jgi:hypothetical protein
MSVQAIEDLDSAVIEEQSRGVIEAEKQCRITLSKNAPRAIPLAWHGGRGHRQTEIKLLPGQTVVQPLSKAQVWFGPFAVPIEFAATTDERRKESLRQFWATEKARYLNRYDYPRPSSVSKQGYEPIGPHRSPDVTVVIVDADGTESPPIRLHELYKIGEYDPLKDTFGNQETAEQIKTRYEGELAGVSQRYEDEIRELRLQMAEVVGLTKGLATASAGGK